MKITVLKKIGWDEPYVCVYVKVLVCTYTYDNIQCIIITQDYKPEEDPSKFQSTKTGRGPLQPDWKVHICIHVCTYVHKYNHMPTVPSASPS